MNAYILVMFVWSNNPFYGSDAVPTLQFKTEVECKTALAAIKTVKDGDRKVNAKGECVLVEQK
jgi:hypothetical protein